MDDASELNDLARRFGQIALEAGSVILTSLQQGISTRLKADRSPVTQADEAAEACVLAALERLLPHVPIVAEERVARGEIPIIDDEFLLVDALDGTREFLAGREEYTVNIALIRHGRPVCGAIYAPASAELYIGANQRAYYVNLCAAQNIFENESQNIEALGKTHIMQRLQTRASPANGLCALASRSHCDARTEEFLKLLPVVQRVNFGSSLKFCVIAAGKADVYPRFSPLMQWDIAAGHAILEAAGGAVLTPQAKPISYGQRGCGFKQNPFIAWGRSPI